MESICDCDLVPTKTFHLHRSPIYILSYSVSLHYTVLAGTVIRLLEREAKNCKNVVKLTAIATVLCHLLDAECPCKDHALSLLVQSLISDMPRVSLQLKFDPPCIPECLVTGPWLWKISWHEFIKFHDSDCGTGKSWTLRFDTFKFSKAVEICTKSSFREALMCEAVKMLHVHDIIHTVAQLRFAVFSRL